jgi:large subunit ribosomal protein L5
MARLKDFYNESVVPQLKEKFGFANAHQIPRLEKVILNMGVGDAVQNARALEFAEQDLTLIAGQKPVIRRAKKSIANFKLREGMPIGVSVTLRRDRMYEFLDRLVAFALPRVRDFRGVPRGSFDGRGNYSMGITEQIIFPEIDLDKTQIRGLSVNVVTSAKDDKEGEALLEMLGFPFRGKSKFN